MNEAIALPSEPVAFEAGLQFDALYRESRDDVYAYVAGLLRDAAAAEEVTAASFERAFRKRARFDPGRGSPRAWLFGIARNAALDELRRRGRQRRLHAEPAELADTAAARAPERAELRLALSEALAELRPRERELIALKHFGGLSNGEIAAVLRISESNVGTRLHRVMSRLKEACDGAA